MSKTYITSKGNKPKEELESRKRAGNEMGGECDSRMLQRGLAEELTTEQIQKGEGKTAVIWGRTI